MKFEKLQKIFYKDNTLSIIIDFLSSLNIKIPEHEFINFETYEKIPLFKKKLKKIEDCAKYNSTTNKIEIFKEVINSKFISDNFHKNSFHRILFNTIKDTDFLKIIFIHEIGHYLQHEDYNINKQLLNNSHNPIISNFINKTLSYTSPEEYCQLYSNNESQTDSKSRRDTNEHLHRIATEGFADCFTYIIFLYNC